MKKYRFTAVFLILIAVVSMILTMTYTNLTAKKQTDEETTGDSALVVTSFYPMYIAAANLLDGIDSIRLENLSEPQTGCLHDYTLTTQDMKLLKEADILIVNGGGIENFIKDVAAACPELTIIEACRDIPLIGTENGAPGTEAASAGTGDSSDESEVNAHVWTSVALHRQQVENICAGLADAFPEEAAAIEANGQTYDEKLADLEQKFLDLAAVTRGSSVILFHEAYAYLADELGMTVAFTLDLDAERQVSAGEVRDILKEISENDTGLILAEETYGASMGETVSAEADVDVLYLDPCTRGDYDPDSYLKAQEKNLRLLSAASPK